MFFIKKIQKTFAENQFAFLLQEIQLIFTQFKSDLLLVAKDDELGRKLQDLDLVTRKRAPNKKEDLV